MLSAQHDLAREDFAAVDGLPVRAALHTGTAHEAGGEYAGPAVNRASSVLALAHGGQVLVSGSTAALVRDRLPADVGLRDLGEYTLGDHGVRERVYQLLAPGLPLDHPPLRSPDAPSNNAPVPLTSFIGREAEIAEIGARIERSRIVTLTGMGGVGKTRLAIEAARSFGTAFPDGVWFVEFAPLSDPSLASARIGEVFGMREQIGTAMSEAWIAALERKHALLVLDNCEHLLDAIARVAQRILERCASMTILATSREPLHLAGEDVVRIAPLPTPAQTAEALPPIDVLRRSPAVQLFLERAPQLRARLDARDDDAERRALVSVCDRLDGIPLAIELAAARVGVLGVNDIAKRLDDRFRILTSGPRTVLPRQQTLRALLDWSYDLLTVPEQSVFQRLAVFSGGWTLEAAQAVCVDDASASPHALAEWDVLDILVSLVDKSLVTAEPQGADVRYRFLETTRAYALEKLEQSGDALRISGLHARYMLAFVETTARSRTSAVRAARAAPIRPELDNVRSALHWALTAKRDVVLGAQLVRSLDFAFEALSLYFEGLTWSTRALDALGDRGDPALVASLLLASAQSHAYIGNPRGCVETAQRMVPLSRTIGKPRPLAYALSLLGFGLAFSDRRAEGDVYAEEALTYARAVGDPGLLAWVLCAKSWTVEPADLALRRALLMESLTLFGQVPERFRVEVALQALSEVEFVAGDYARSKQYAREGASIERRIGPNVAVWCLARSAAASLAAGDVAEAHRDALDALSSGRRRGSGVFAGACIAVLAAVSAEHGDHARAARLLGAADAQFDAVQRSPMVQEQFVRTRALTLLHQAFDDRQLAALLAEGRAWSVDHAVDVALGV
jgi:predicted ATPase